MKQKYEIFCGVQIQALIVDVILDKSSIVSDASGSSPGATCYIESMNLGIGFSIRLPGRTPAHVRDNAAQMTTYDLFWEGLHLCPITRPRPAISIC